MNACVSRPEPLGGLEYVELLAAPAPVHVVDKCNYEWARGVGGQRSPKTGTPKLRLSALKRRSSVESRRCFSASSVMTASGPRWSRF